MKKTKFQFLYARVFERVLAEYSRLEKYLGPFLSGESPVSFTARVVDDFGNIWKMNVSLPKSCSCHFSFRSILFEMYCVKYSEYFADNHFTTDFSSLELGSVRNFNRLKFFHNLFLPFKSILVDRYDDLCSALKYFDYHCTKSVKDGGIF